MSVFSEEPYDATTPVDLPPASLAAVHRTGLRIDDLGSTFDAAFGALGKAIAAGSLTPSGPAVAVYRGDPMEVFDLDVGFPVDEALSASLTVDGLEIVAAELPSGPALATTVIGPYDGLGEAWARLAGESTALGHSPAGVWIEVYVSDPSVTAPAELRTDLILPVLR
ncbi:MAG: hypothetical protein B7X41_05685 [Microbacterium sp. 14-71-5]|jgi:effector-binding domain-containing protein|uniref:GyrI-like domain-containing protein n=1 Tax=Microbacterium sp. 13-71-7 TaxID=1970399 RepID=UPI000BC3D42B|nr:GyrI-like domain-containing protein [Microbacterium sp. 13-71-7]OZB85651.1 MAG: hypothetical protein B7X32_02720 [Microbacterium sp. 13-71-7]OZB88903.1 MAG: hypothetical protein B7X41_05685 [Microbacterium sp. 14-71-5]